jgi:hypothetical protein
MSVQCTEPARPKFLCSLTELSQTLDQTAEATPFAELETPTPRRHRRNLVETWHVGMAGLGLLWVLFCGFLISWAGNRPAYSQCGGTMPATTHDPEPTIPQPDDPVQQGRGGRTPQVLSPLAEDIPGGECLGTRIAFVEGLDAATRQAKDRNKLLMILNVSGDFDDARFT